jgi:VWFA-related protein
MSALTVAVFLLGQAAPATAPGTEVRALTVTLLDEKDREVTDVSPADVAVVENGVSRDITSFKPDRRPLSVAVLVDSSAAMGSAYRLNVVEAVVGLVARLPDGTRYALWTTGDRPTKIVDHTDDREAAGKALRLVAPQGGNYMLDAFGEASADLKKLSREGDRTAVVAVTGTGPEFSYSDKYRAAEQAEKNAELYLSVEIDSGDAELEARANLSYVMDRMARATGGRYDVILSPMGLDSALRKVSAHLRSGYRLAYATVPDLRKRSLDLSVARTGTKVILPSLSSREASPREP